MCNGVFLPFSLILNRVSSWIDKKDIVQISEYFAEPKSSKGRAKLELDLPNYAKK